MQTDSTAEVNGSTSDATEFRASKPYTTYVLVVLATINLLCFVDRLMLSVLLEPIKKDLGLSDVQLGLMTGVAFALFYATVGIPVARLADRKSRVMIVSIATALWSLMTVMTGFANSFTQMLLARFGVGVGEAGCLPPGHSLLSDYYPPQRRAFAIGMFMLGGGVGTMLGQILAGVIGAKYGWRWAFFVLGAPGLIVALVTILSVREPPKGRFEGQSKVDVKLNNFRSAVTTLFGRRTYVHILIAYALSNFALYGLMNWLPTFFVRSYGLSLSEVGMAVGLACGGGAMVGMALGSVLAPKLVARDRRWETWMPAISHGLCLPLFLSMLSVQSLTAALVIGFFAMLSATFGIGAGLSCVQSCAEPNLRATAMSLVMFCSALIGMGGGPLVVGVLSDQFTPIWLDSGLRVALVAPALVFAWATLHFTLAGRSLLNDKVN